MPHLAGSIAMSTTRQAPFSYPRLERIFHERGRLAICTCLIAHPDGLSFTELQASCDLSDGNLNRHVHALAELGIVITEKLRGSGRPQTVYRITKRGRQRFLAYVDELEAVVRDVHERSRRGAAQAKLATT
jgi:predicted ArsR family transcriptional regulator